MRIVLALDKFKGTFTAQQVCELLAEGIRRRNPKIEVLPRPMADGGEGSASILSAALGMETMRVSVPDLLGRTTEAHIHWQNTRRIALIEAASLLGVARTVAREDVLLQSCSAALGRLMQKALDLRPAEIWIGVGGTMTADAGWGLASLFGLEAVDSEGNSLSPSPANMERIASLACGPRPEILSRVRVTALCDVNAPASASSPVSLLSFLEQKGASAQTKTQFAERISRFWRLLQTANPAVLKLEDAYTGSGGGLCLGASAVIPHFQAELGAHRIARAIALAPSLSNATLAVCGEGCLDETSFYGKAPTVVAEIAQQTNTPIAAVFGRVRGDEERLGKRLGVVHISTLFTQPPNVTSELVRASRQRLVEIGISLAQLAETLATSGHNP